MQTEYEMSLLIHMKDSAYSELILQEANQHNWALHLARTGGELMHVISVEAVDLVILEVGHPSSAGCALCRAVRTEFSVEELPVLLVLDKRCPYEVSQFYAMGANDYVAKPFNSCELLARIHMQLKLRMMQRRIIQSMLTKAEKEILQIYSQHRGEKRREIIKLLNEQKPHPITLKTLDNHITNILKKIDATHIADAAAKAKKHRWI